MREMRKLKWMVSKFDNNLGHDSKKEFKIQYISGKGCESPPSMKLPLLQSTPIYISIPSPLVHDVHSDFLVVRSSAQESSIYIY
jgi:hypothetical protein